MSRTTVATLLSETATALAAAGIDEPRRDARLLLCHALGITPECAIREPERTVGAPGRERLAALTRRRCDREPVSRITGRREFWSLTFRLSPDTLDPRPESETLVEALLAVLPSNRPLRLLDLGTGSGCLMLALLSELPQAHGLGVDRNPRACTVAAGNAAALGLSDRAKFCAADWGQALTGRFDAIVSNPPYVPEAEIDRLAPEVARHEPRCALTGGPDGLAAYRALADDCRRLLRPGGVLALEVGANQARAVRVILAAAGLLIRSARADLSGIERCLLAETPGLPR